MTQLVELQEALPKFKAAGIKLYAVSYDEPEALAEFAKHHAIEYPLLSDRGSKVIREYGIQNTFVTKDQVPYYGIPFPGTYLVDETGYVSETFFNRHLATRESAETVIDSALGEILLSEEEPSANGGNDDIRVSVTYHGGGGTIKSAVRRQLIVRFDLAPGLHIYDEPVPEGMVATSISVSGPEGLNFEPVQKPPTAPLSLPGLETELRVWDGQVDFVVPVWADDRLLGLVDGIKQPDVTIDVEVAYQACDDSACRIPQREKLTITVPLAEYTAHKLAGRLDGTKVSSMNSHKYFYRMLRRALLRSPIGGLRYLKWAAKGARNGPAGRRAKQ